MFLLKNKIRKLMALLDSKKAPEDLKEITQAIELSGPQPASPAFQKKLKQQLLLKHSTMPKFEPDSKAANASQLSSGHNENHTENKAGRFNFFFAKSFGVALAAVILVAVVGLVIYPSIPSPTVHGYELKDNIRKISYNAPIKVVFSQPMDHGSVENGFTMDPKVSGHFGWSGNSLMFYPDQQFKVGDAYRVKITKTAKSIFGKTMPYEYQEIFQATQAPKVLLFSPATETENVDIASSITVMFDRPMTALTSLDQGEAKAPEIKIDPPLKGRYKWLGTSAISFIPGKLQYATKYTVTIPKGTNSAEGGVTDQDFVYTFTTLKPYLVQTSPVDMEIFNGPKTKVRLDFNQPMDLNRAKEFIHFYKLKEANLKEFDQGSYSRGGYNLVQNFDTGKWQEVDFAPRYQTAQDLQDPAISNPGVYTNEARLKLDTSEENAEQLSKSIILEPASELNYNSIYLVKIDKGFAGTEGTYTLEDNNGILFKTVGQIQITSTYPFNGADLSKDKDPDSLERYPNLIGNAQIRFSQPMDTASLEGKVSITPVNIDKDTKKAEEPQLVPDSSDLVISYGFKASTEYVITLKGGSKDQFGQTYDKDFSFKFKAGPLDPNFKLLTRSDITILDLNKPPVFYLRTTNLNDVNFNLRKLSEEEFRKIYNRGYVNDYYLKTIPGPFTSWNQKVQNKFNEQVITQVNLTRASGQVLDAGIYYLDLSNSKISESDNKTPILERQIFMVSGTALATKKSTDELLVWATSLKDGNPKPNTQIKVWDSIGSEAFSGTTDQDGLASFKLPEIKPGEDLYGRDYTVIASSEGDYSLGHTSWSDGISPWNFNLSYSPVHGDYFIYSYTDRPIYRPGDQVYFKGLVRKDLDASFQLPDLKKVHVEVDDSQGEKVYEQDLTLNSNGTFNGELKLSGQARTGGYMVITSLPDAKGPEYVNRFYSSFKIAEYRKPDYKLDLETDKKSYLNGDKAKIKVKAGYFFGAPLANANVEWTVRSQDYFFFLDPASDNPYAQQWFSFSDEGYLCFWGCEGENSVVTTGKATLDQNGEYTIELPLDITGKKMSQFYTIEVTASDLNNQTVSNRTTVPVHAGEYYVGIMNPDYVVSKNDPVKFNLITVDENGKSVAGKTIDVSFFKRNWNTVKKKNVDSDFYYENNYEDVLVDKKTVSTNEKGWAEISFAAKDSGDFKAMAESRDSRGNKIAASTTVYVSGEGFVNWGRENNDRIELINDKQEYKPGDTAHILVKSPYQNVTALVTYERQNILQKKVIKITSNSQTIDVPITEKSIPNLFVSVLLVKGNNSTAGLAEPPIGQNDEREVAAFKLGYTTLRVNTSSKKLQVEVTPQQSKYAPGQEAKLKIKTTDNNGKPVKAEVSVAVVDKSVLSLTESVTADLLSQFYATRILGVETSENLTKALSRVNVQVEAGLKGGGGAEPQKRGTFKDTAYWESVVNTNAQGEAEVSFKLPDNLTTWEVLAIGITPDTLVGSQKADFLVTKDVLVRPILPRFLIVNDTMKVGAIVHNYLDKPMDFEVGLNGSGLNFAVYGDEGKPSYTTEGRWVHTEADKQNIHLDPGQEKKIEWTTTVLNEKEADLTFSVKAVNDQSIGDILEQKIPIHPYSFPEIVATSDTISDSDKHVETVWLPIGVDQNFGELTLSVAPTLAGSIADGLEYLMSYPYGCVEQITSSLLPNVLIKQVLDLPSLKNAQVDQKTLQKNVEVALQSLYKYQNANGGWGLWQTSNASSYLTAYVLHGLYEAQKAGFAVDQNVMNRARDYIKNSINIYPLKMPNNKADASQRENLRYDASLRAYVLYVLAEIGNADLGLTNNLYEFKDYLNLFAKTYLAMAFDDLAKDKANEAVSADLQAKVGALRDIILNSAKQSPRGVHFEETNRQYRLFDTDTRTTALVLQMLSRTNPDNPLVPKILRYMLMEKKDGRYQSTQETAVSLMALIDYLKSSHELEPAYTGNVALNGLEKLNKAYTRKNIGDHDTVKISLKDLLPDNQDNEITFDRSGMGKMYFDMTLKYYLPTEKIKAREEGIIVKHEYFNTEDKKFEHPVNTVKVGENLKAKMTIVIPEDRYYVMVEDFLPAGLEGIDFSLNTSQQELLNRLQDNYFGEMAKGGYDGKGYYYGNGINNWWFNYSEFRDDRVMYFADYLPAGVYEIDYFVRATTPGIYHDLPVLAQETYFPEVFGRSAGNIFEVHT